MLNAVVGLGVLFAFAALGDILGRALRLPLPGSVLGLVLLWSALGVGLVKLAWVARAADALLSVLGLLFVPAGVGLVAYLSLWREWPAWLGVVLGSVLLGATVAGKLAERLEERE